MPFDGEFNAFTWHSESAYLADVYSRGLLADKPRCYPVGATIYPTLVSIENPFSVTAKHRQWVTALELLGGVATPSMKANPMNKQTHQWLSEPEVLSAIEQAGFDGVKMMEGSVATWLVFSGDQVRFSLNTQPVDGPQYNPCKERSHA